MTQTCRSCHRPYHIADARFCPLCGASVADPRQTILHHPPLQRPAVDPKKSDPAATLLFGADPSTAIRAELERQEQLAVADTVRPRPVAEAMHALPSAEPVSRQSATGKARQHSVAQTVRIDPVAPGVPATNPAHGGEANEERPAGRESSPFTPSPRAGTAAGVLDSHLGSRDDSQGALKPDGGMDAALAGSDSNLEASDAALVSSMDEAADSLADAAGESAVMPFDLSDDDEPLMVPRRSYRNLALAAGAVMLLVGALAIIGVSGSHGPADDEKTEKTEETKAQAASPALLDPAVPASDVAAPADETAAADPAVNPTSAAQPATSEPAVATSRSSEPRSRRRRSSRRSRSSAREPRPTATSTSDRLRADPASFLDSTPASAPAAPVTPAPAPTAPVAAAPRQPAPSGDQPLDPFADKAPAAPARPARKPASEEPIDPFGPGASDKPAAKPREEPIDPFGPDSSAPPRGEQPIDPFADSGASGSSARPASAAPASPAPAPAPASPAPAASTPDAPPASPAVPERRANADQGDDGRISDDIRNDEKRAVAFVKQGKAHLAAGRTSAAQASFARALGLDPHNRAALEGLAATRPAR